MHLLTCKTQEERNGKTRKYRKIEAASIATSYRSTRTKTHSDNFCTWRILLKSRVSQNKKSLALLNLKRVAEERWLTSHRSRGASHTFVLTRRCVQTETAQGGTAGHSKAISPNRSRVLRQLKMQTIPRQCPKVGPHLLFVFGKPTKTLAWISLGKKQLNMTECRRRTLAAYVSDMRRYPEHANVNVFALHPSIQLLVEECHVGWVVLKQLTTCNIQPRVS